MKMVMLIIVIIMIRPVIQRIWDVNSDCFNCHAITAMSE